MWSTNKVVVVVVVVTAYLLIDLTIIIFSGNTSHDRAQNLLLKNPGAKDARSTPLNNKRMKPLNTASRKIHRENTYASAERCTRGTKDAEKPVYDNPGCALDGDKPVYQSLVKEDARAQFNSNPNAEVYQSLNPDGMMYQPLQKNTVHKVGSNRFLFNVHLSMQTFVASFILFLLPLVVV